MTKSLVQQQFGKHAAAYTSSAVHAKGASLARLLELVAPKGDWRVLDVATGAGHTAAAFAPHVASVIASDLTREMLDEADALAASKGLANMRSAPADAEALPFADASFELVTCRIAAHHFPDVRRFLVEAERVLVPGGVLAVVDNVAPDQKSTDGFSPAEQAEAAGAYNAFEKIRDPSHGRCLGLGEWSDLVEAAGLNLTHAELLPKDMEFHPWAERMGADAAVVERLRSILIEAEPVLRAFLRPRTLEGNLWFTLEEAILIARKSA